MEIIPCVSQKTDATIFPLDDPFAFFEASFTLLVRSFVSGVKWRIHVISIFVNRRKSWGICGETWLNTRWKHPCDAVSVVTYCGQTLHPSRIQPYSNYRSICDIQFIVKCLSFQLDYAFLINDHIKLFGDFLKLFQACMLIWFSITLFVFAVRTASFKLFHTIFYCCKRKSRLPPE